MVGQKDSHSIVSSEVVVVIRDSPILARSGDTYSVTD